MNVFIRLRLCMRNCRICQVEFVPTSPKALNCKEHIGLRPDSYKVENGKLLRRCSLCKDHKVKEEFNYSTAEDRISRYCKKCQNGSTYKHQKVRAEDRKKRLIQVFGGKCMLCGYSRNYAALCFHHTRDKELKLDARTMSGSRWDDILAEAQKCQLLCANCHNEVHHPQSLL